MKMLVAAALLLTAPVAEAATMQRTAQPKMSKPIDANAMTMKKHHMKKKKMMKSDKMDNMKSKE